MSYDSYIENINESRRLMNNMINLMNNQERNMRIIINNNNRNNNRNNNSNNNSNNNRNIWDNYFLVSDPFNYSRNTSIQLTREELNRLNSINVTRPLNNSSTSNIPTRNQISRATNTTLFSNIVNPSNNTCPISRDRFNSNDTVTQISPCGHIFTSNNLQQWFTYHSVCPMCRYDIRNYNPSTSNTNRSNTNRSNTNRSNTNRSNTNRSNTNRSNHSLTSSSITLDNLNNIAEQIAGDILNNVTDASNNNVSLEYSLYTPYNSTNIIPIFNRALNNRTTIDPSLNLL